MNKCFCDLCGKEIEFDDKLRLIQIKVRITLNGRTNNEEYIDSHLNHLCYQCRLNFVRTVSAWIQDQRRINGLDKKRLLDKSDNIL